MSKYFSKDYFEVNDNGSIWWYSFDDAINNFNRELYDRDKEIYKMKMEGYKRQREYIQNSSVEDDQKKLKSLNKKKADLEIELNKIKKEIDDQIRLVQDKETKSDLLLSELVIPDDPVEVLKEFIVDEYIRYKAPFDVDCTCDPDDECCGEWDGISNRCDGGNTKFSMVVEEEDERFNYYGGFPLNIYPDRG